TMRHESTYVAHPFGCVYMQTAAISIAKNLKLEEKGIRVLSPVFDLDMGLPTMGKTMVGMGTMLGHLPPTVMKCMLKGANAMRKYLTAIHEWGRELLDNIGPDEKVLVLVTRPYGIADPVLNMSIPELLLERGYKVITNSQLPGDHEVDLSEDYPNMYWPFGEHILSSAKLIKNHPNLYMVYLTNHGCGPDTMLQHMVAEEMGDKPYLQVEVDEHFSKVGVITRIEAFLNSFENRPTEPLPEYFEIRDVAHKQSSILPSLRDVPVTLRDAPVYTPHLGLYTEFFAAYVRETYGQNAVPQPAPEDDALGVGRSVTRSKEYLSFVATAGSALQTPAGGTLLIPATQGSEADGVYHQVIRDALDRRGRGADPVVAPLLETLPSTAADLPALFRAVLAGDLLYAAPAGERETLRLKFLADGSRVPSAPVLRDLAADIGAMPVTGRTLAAEGTPLCLTDLDSGVLGTLEAEGETVLRQPLSEYLWFLWADCGDNDPAILKPLKAEMAELHALLGPRSPFSEDPEKLMAYADRYVRVLCGGNGRYRYAKAAEFSKTASAVLALTPRYENTATILDMRELPERCDRPFFRLQLDNDWDESAWARLRSFLYYI
ncbi:MAG: CoA-substrate-specific enzyme activase, partial [Clostridia bacterium]|nr:CoA-substrate-specific enzyme activase [Clostridia bacterium]